MDVHDVTRKLPEKKKKKKILGDKIFLTWGFREDLGAMTWRFFMGFLQLEAIRICFQAMMIVSLLFRFTK